MTAKRREAPAETQGELDMMGGDPAPGVPPPPADVAGGDPEPEAGESRAEESAAESAGESPAPETASPAVDASPPELAGTPVLPAPAPGAAGDSRLHAALEGLDERVTFMVTRFEDLRRRYAEAVEAGRRAEAAVARRAEPGADPAELDARIRELEAENERLARHAGFLEERIQSLLSRVRYVIEA